jgi:hypothetical protein
MAGSTDLIMKAQSFVMAGLVPAIHVFAASKREGVDARHKAGHDEAGGLRMAGPANSPSPNARNPAKLEKLRRLTPSLDFRGLAAITAQPLGSLSLNMRNIITKLLIVVVPKRTAGGG